MSNAPGDRLQVVVRTAIVAFGFALGAAVVKFLGGRYRFGQDALIEAALVACAFAWLLSSVVAAVFWVRAEKGVERDGLAAVVINGAAATALFSVGNFLTVGSSRYRIDSVELFFPFVFGVIAVVITAQVWYDRAVRKAEG